MNKKYEYFDTPHNEIIEIVRLPHTHSTNANFVEQ